MVGIGGRATCPWRAPGIFLLGAPGHRRQQDEDGEPALRVTDAPAARGDASAWERLITNSIA
eukprot:4222889-Pyramimonas_sp.AAC.1